MTKKFLLAICIVAFSVALATPLMKVSSSETDSVGVKAGDWAGFGDISFEWESNMPGYEQYMLQLNVSWADFEVLDVSDSNVTVRSTIIYKNGTESIEIVSGDIATGEGNLSVMVIPSNLVAGDEIPANVTWYTAEPLKLTINGTVTRSYAGASREVNYANITYPIIAYPPPPHAPMHLGYLNMSLYWDQKTGIVCEEIVSYATSWMQDSTHYYMNMSILWRMTATNMWPAGLPIDWNGYAFNITTISNSTLSNFSFSQPDKQISFNVTGPEGKVGYCNVTIPKTLLDGPFVVLIDGSPVSPLPIVTQNSTHSFVYFTYSLSTNEVEIVGTTVIPEFPTATAFTMAVFGIAVALVLGRRLKAVKKPV